MRIKSMVSSSWRNALVVVEPGWHSWNSARAGHRTRHRSPGCSGYQIRSQPNSSQICKSQFLRQTAFQNHAVCYSSKTFCCFTNCNYVRYWFQQRNCNLRHQACAEGPISTTSCALFATLIFVEALTGKPTRLPPLLCMVMVLCWIVNDKLTKQ